MHSQVILEFGHTSTLRDVVDAVPGAATHDWEVSMLGFEWNIEEFDTIAWSSGHNCTLLEQRALLLFFRDHILPNRVQLKIGK